MHWCTKSVPDAPIHKTAEATGDLIGNKMTDKFTKNFP